MRHGRVPLHLVNVLVCCPGFGAALVCREALALGVALAHGDALTDGEVLVPSAASVPSAAQVCGTAATSLPSAVSVPSAASIPGIASAHVQGLVPGATSGTALVRDEALIPGASLVQNKAPVHSAASVHDAASVCRSPAPHALFSPQASTGWPVKPVRALRPKESRRRCPRRWSGRQRLALSAQRPR